MAERAVLLQLPAAAGSGGYVVSFQFPNTRSVFWSHPRDHYLPKIFPNLASALETLERTVALDLDITFATCTRLVYEHRGPPGVDLGWVLAQLTSRPLAKAAAKK